MAKDLKKINVCVARTLLAAAATLLLVPQALAATWIPLGAADWNSGGNWAVGTGIGGLPGPADAALVLNGGTAQISGVLTEPVVDQIYAGQLGGTSGTITQSGGSITATSWAVVGDAAGSTGTYNMTGGALNVTNDVLAVSNSGGFGTFNINGAGTVNANRIYVGRAGGGTGIFNQSGGSVTSNQWTVVGEGAGTTGSYSLSGGGSLAVNSDIFYVGLSNGNGTFNLGSGTVNGPQMRVGDFGGIGVFNHNAGGGTVAMTGESLVGFRAGGNGTYTQAAGAGTHTSGSWLSVGRDGGTGLYNKNAATADTHGTLQIGINAGSNGTFNLSGGSVTTTAAGAGAGDIGSVTVGFNGGVGELNIAGGTTLTTTARSNVGWGGTGTVNVDAGGTYNGVDMWIGRNAGGNGTVNTSGSFNLSNVLALGSGTAGSTGTINQDGGTVTVQNVTHIGAEPGGTGIYNLNSGAFTGNAETTIGLNNSTGTFNVSGGTATVNARTRVGWQGDGTLNVAPGATFNGVDMWVGRSQPGVSNGTVTTAGSFNLSNTLALGSGTGSSALGTFNQNGGTVGVGLHLYVGAESNQGVYNLQDGTLNVTNEFRVGLNGTSTGTFTQNGGTVNADNSIVLAQDAGTTGTVNQNGGIVNAGISGQPDWMGVGHAGTATYNLSGGTLNARGIGLTSNVASLSIGATPTSNGTFNQTGGTVFSESGLTMGRDAGSQAAYNISGGSLNILGGGVGNQALEVGRAGTAKFTVDGSSSTITVNGNYTQNGLSTLNSVLDNGGVSQIQVLGTTTLAAGSVVDVDLSGGAALLTNTMHGLVGGGGAAVDSSALDAASETLWNKSTIGNTVFTTLDAALDQGPIAFGGSTGPFAGINEGYVSITGINDDPMKVLLDVDVTNATLSDLINFMSAGGLDAAPIGSSLGPGFDIALTFNPTANNSFFAWDFSDFDIANSSTTLVLAVGAVIPEPSTFMLAVIGLLCAGCIRRRRHRIA